MSLPRVTQEAARILLAAVLLVPTAGSTDTESIVPGPAVWSRSDSLLGHGVIDTRLALQESKARLIASLYEGDPVYTAPQYQAIARICARLGQYDEAERWFDKILSFNSFEITTLTDLAEMHLVRAEPNPERADFFLTKAEMAADRLFPGTEEDARVRQVRGRYYMITRDLGKARKQFARAKGYWQADPPLELLFWDAECALDQGDYKESLELYLELIGRTRGLDRRALEGFYEAYSLDDEPIENDVETLIAQAIEREERKKAEHLDEIGGAPVAIESADGFELAGTLFHPTRSGDIELPRPGGTKNLALLFLPTLGSDRNQWNGAASMFMRQGFVSLTLDLRGYGDSRSRNVPTSNDLGSRAVELWEEDVRAAVDFLRSSGGGGPAHVAIISVAQSCALAALAAHNSSVIDGLVFLSPLFDINRHAVMSTLQFHARRPLHCIGSREDLASLKEIRNLMNLNSEGSRRTKKLFIGAGHGINILRREPACLTDMLAWIEDLESDDPLDHSP